MAGLAVVTASLVFADRLGLVLAESGVNAAAARLLMVDQPGSLAAWWEAGLWLAVTGQCVLLFGMRKHRTDDTSNAYRWWLIAAAAAVGMSITSATHAHQAVAGQMAELTGVSPLPNAAFWWLVPSVVLLGAVGLRSLLEVKESPLAFTFASGAAVASLVAAVAGVLTAPGTLTGGVAPSLVSSAAAMSMAGLTLLTLLAYSRRIVRESLGEVERPATKPAKVNQSTDEKADAEQEFEPAVEDAKPAKRPRRAEPVIAAEVDDEEEEPTRRRLAKPKRPKLAKETTTEWVSGPEADDEYDEGPKRRKLSKAERKRLRREKARRAA
ncbi:MAG: hypothetical protein AAF266_06980 [Planctomycetota bacterium]